MKLHFSYVRCNPPTIAHKALFDRIYNASKQDNSNYKIVLSHTQNKTNPLSLERKLYWLKLACPDYNFYYTTPENNIIKILSLENKDHDELVFYCGSDRVEHFSKLLNQYNDKEFNFNKITIVDIGNRTGEDNIYANVSSSTQREFIKNGDFQGFQENSIFRDIGEYNIGLYNELISNLY